MYVVRACMCVCVLYMFVLYMHACVCVCVLYICVQYVCVLVHKRMFYIRTNLRMLQHSNVECNIRMVILCNKMMYYGDFVVLVCYITNKFMFVT